MDTSENQTPAPPASSVALSHREAALIGEYDKAMKDVELRRLSLIDQRAAIERQFEELAQAKKNVVDNMHGTVRLIIRQRELQGDWRPSDDSQTLVRVG